MSRILTLSQSVVQASYFRNSVNELVCMYKFDQLEHLYRI